MRLNGWQRIGVLLSIGWIAGAICLSFKTRQETITQGIPLGKTIVELETGEKILFPAGTTSDTLGKAIDDYVKKQDLSKYSDAQLDAMIAAHPDNPANKAMEVAHNSLPVPVTWFFVYCMIWIFRWVKAGFVSQRS